MRIYVAGDFARAAEVDALASRCVAEAGVEVVSRWHRRPDESEVAAAGRIGGPADPASAERSARRNVEDIDRSDVLVLLTTGGPGRGGRHFETGYAYAGGKTVVVVGAVEHAFHWLPGVHRTTSDALVEALVTIDLAGAGGRPDILP